MALCRAPPPVQNRRNAFAEAGLREMKTMSLRNFISLHRTEGKSNHPLQLWQRDRKRTSQKDEIVRGSRRVENDFPGGS